MPRYYVAVESKESYGQKWTSPPSYGFNLRFKKLAEETRAGDMLADYVKGCGYACIMKILTWEGTEDTCEYKPHLNPTALAFPWRVRIEPLLQIDDCKRMPKYRELESYLECCRRNPSDHKSPPKNPGWLQGRHLFEISEHDFGVIEEAIRKALRIDPYPST